MKRLLLLSLLVLSSLMVTAAEPVPQQQEARGYRIIFRAATGQVSLPDDPWTRTVFIDLNNVGKGQAQTFGGPQRARFKVVKFITKTEVDPKVGQRDVSELVCEEVATKNVFTLILGKEFQLFR